MSECEIAQRFKSFNNERGNVNMTKKVTLPREVAEAIESLRNRGASDQDIVAYGIERYTIVDAGIIYNYGQEHFRELMSALVNGYEIEKSPEERLREYLSEMERYRVNADSKPYYQYCRGRTEGALVALNILGIQIEGINA